MPTVSPAQARIVASVDLPPAVRSPQLVSASIANANSTTNADRLREAFTQFVGETFYGQMIKAMRSTVGKPAYFHGGRAEEVFRGQLDQALAEHLTETTANRFADPMFHRQFPDVEPAAVLEKSSARQSGLSQLGQLPRR
jgi:Rod binding domain-containing protein